MTQKQEFICECGRTYITYGEPSIKPKKCPRCGRVMRLTEEKKRSETVAAKPEAHIDSAPPSAGKGKNPLSYLDETWEYEYKFNNNVPNRSQNEPFTIVKVLQKIWMLFFPGRRSRRY